MTFVGFCVSQCLPEAALKSLGFTTVKTTPEKIDKAPYCKGRFKQWGACVTMDELKAIFEKDKQNVDATTGDTTVVQTAIGTIADSVTTDAEKTALNNIKKSVQDDSQKCNQSLKNIQAGKLCFLVSGQAGASASWDGTNITLQVDQTAVGSELQKCQALVDATCLLVTGQSTQQDVTIDDSTNFQTTSNQATQCKNLNKNRNCSGDACS